jgi:uncharacterized protein (TIRG00374 family)
VLSLVLTGVAIYIVSGRTDELSGASTYLEDLSWYWIVIAVVFEIGSVVAYAALQRQLLAAGSVRIHLPSLTGITLAGYSIQNSLPAGIIFSSVFAFRQFNHRGADEVLSGWTLVATTVISMITLVAMAGLGLAASSGTGTGLDLVWVIAALVIFTLFLVYLWSRREPIMRSLIRPLLLVQRVIRRPRGDARLLLDQVIDRMNAVTPTPTDWLVSTFWAAAVWVFDAGCLIVAFQAVGSDIPWRALPLAYSAAQLAANLPITPGGLGVVEGSLTIALVAYGGGQASTVAAVLVYRLISFWAILPSGWLAWALVNWQVRRSAGAHLVSPGPVPTEAET